MLRIGYGGAVSQAGLVFCVLGLLAALLAWLMQPILVPLLISAILYSLLEPMTDRLARKGLSHSHAVTVLMISLLVGLSLLLFIFLPTLGEQFVNLQNHIPQFAHSLSTLGPKLDAWVGTIGLTTNGVTGQWVSSIQSWGATAVMSSASILIQIAMMVVLVPLITFFLLRDYRSARNRLMGFLPNQQFELGWLVYYRVTRQLQRYVSGVVIQSAIMAVVSSIGFSLVGLDMAILFGCLTGLLNIIPYIGAVIAALLPCAVVLTSGVVDAWQIFGIVAVVLFAQLVDNVVVIPAVIANSIGLHPLIVLLGVIIFGSFFGMLGMLLAVPLMAVAKIFLLALLKGLEGESAKNSEKSSGNISHEGI